MSAALNLELYLMVRRVIKVIIAVLERLQRLTK